MSDDQPAAGPTSSLFRNKDFVALMICRPLQTAGVHAMTVAVGWHVYQLSGDPLDLGLIGLAQFLPALALFLVAGYAADRYERRRILVSCSLVECLAALGIGLLFIQGVASVPWILFILLFHGAARMFFLTASQALLPNLVTKEEFPHAVAVFSTASKAATLIGPAMGGVLIAIFDTQVYFALLCFFMISAVAGLIIRRGLVVANPDAVSLAFVLGGFGYVWRNKIVLGAMSLDLFAVLMGGVMGLLPIFASDILNVGETGLGIMRAAPGAGSLIVGVILARMASPRHLGMILFWATAVFGAAIVVFSLSEVFWLSLIALLIYGGADMISVYVRLNLIQLATPDAMRGRVSSINSISINASNELGDMRAGLTAAFTGAVPAVLVGGLITMVVAGTWSRMFPSIRAVDHVSDIKHS